MLIVNSLWLKSMLFVEHCISRAKKSVLGNNIWASFVVRLEWCTLDIGGMMAPESASSENLQ